MSVTTKESENNSVVNGGLVRAIGLRAAVLFVITDVIGSAIFLTPGVMAARLPSEMLLLFAWAVGGIIALCGGLTYAEMGAMYPRSGGLYVFLNEAFGRLVAFLYGWTVVLVIVTGATAAVAMGFATYFSYFFPVLSTTHIIVRIPLPWGSWTISAAQVIAAISILALGAINYVGIKSGNRAQTSLTVIKIAAIALLPVLAFVRHPATLSLTPVIPHVAHPAAAFGVVMIAVMWAYEGWYYLPFCAGEISEYQDVVAGAKYLQSLRYVDPQKIGLWGGSYGGYLTAMGLARDSDIFKAGVDYAGVHDWTAFFGGRGGGGASDEMRKTAYESSPVASIDKWKSPVLLIQADDDRNVQFSQTVNLVHLLREHHIPYEQIVFPDEVHDSLLWRTWISVFQATGDFFDRTLVKGEAIETVPPED